MRVTKREATAPNMLPNLTPVTLKVLHGKEPEPIAPTGQINQSPGQSEQRERRPGLREIDNQSPVRAT